MPDWESRCRRALSYRALYVFQVSEDNGPRHARPHENAMSSIEASSVDDAAAAAAALAEPLERHGIDKLLESIGDCQFVLLGEATHGSAEFYQRRAEITRWLIEEKGFSIIMVEGDWPCAHRVARYISCEPDSSTDRSAAEALSSFDHFPGWMWNNEPTAELVSWLKQHNDGVRSERADESAARAAYDEMLAAGAMPEQMRAAGIDVECHDRPTGASDRPVVAFYGMDVYSVHASAKAVLAFLDLVDPDAGPRAVYAFSRRTATTSRRTRARRCLATSRR